MTGYTARVMRKSGRIQLQKQISDTIFVRNFPQANGTFIPHIKIEGVLSDSQSKLISNLGLNCGHQGGDGSKAGYQISFKRTITNDLKKSIVTMEALTPIAEILKNS